MSIFLDSDILKMVKQFSEKFGAESVYHLRLRIPQMNVGRFESSDDDRSHLKRRYDEMDRSVQIFIRSGIFKHVSGSIRHRRYEHENGPVVGDITEEFLVFGPTDKFNPDAVLKNWKQAMKGSGLLFTDDEFNCELVEFHEFYNHIESFMIGRSAKRFSSNKGVKKSLTEQDEFFLSLLQARTDLLK